MKHPKFIQIKITDDFGGYVYALDEHGEVWVHDSAFFCSKNRTPWEVLDSKGEEKQ